MSPIISTPNRKASALDAEVPRTGRAADAYEVAQTAIRLCEAWDRTEGEQGNLAPARHAVTLHRISGHLHKLAERGCNEDLTCQECEGTGDLNGPGEKERTCPGCIGHGTTVGRRLERLRADAREIAEHYGLRIYFQTDPRGCSLYLIDPAVIPPASELAKKDVTHACSPKAAEYLISADAWIDANYNRGFAVCRLGR